MDALDGNAIAGSLREHFGIEMTSERGTCVFCGATGQVAELRVYVSGPGAVARCPSCGSAVLALVRSRGGLRIHHESFELAPRSTGSAV